MFFARLYEEVHGAGSLEEVLERGLMFAHRSIVEHEVLQRVMETEPEVLCPSSPSSPSAPGRHRRVPRPYLHEHGMADGVDVQEAADFLARMVLSYISAPGRWDLDDPDQVAPLVRTELLAGVVAGPGPRRPGRR